MKRILEFGIRILWGLTMLILVHTGLYNFFWTKLTLVLYQVLCCRSPAGLFGIGRFINSQPGNTKTLPRNILKFKSSGLPFLIFMNQLTFCQKFPWSSSKPNLSWLHDISLLESLSYFKIELLTDKNKDQEQVSLEKRLIQSWAKASIIFLLVLLADWKEGSD